MIEHDIKAVFADIDCTLAGQDSDIPFDYVRSWLSNISENNIEIVLLSNNFKSRVEKFSAQFGLPFVHFSMKPFPLAAIRAEGKLKNRKIKRKNCAVIGDQIFTDILCANLSGMISILVNPNTSTKYRLSFFRDTFEKPIRENLKLNTEAQKGEK